MIERGNPMQAWEFWKPYVRGKSMTVVRFLESLCQLVIHESETKVDYM